MGGFRSVFYRKDVEQAARQIRRSLPPFRGGASTIYRGHEGHREKATRRALDVQDLPGACTFGFQFLYQGFVEKIETQFDSPFLPVGMDIRDTVNEAYEKISNAMIDSLQAIAKDTSFHQPTGNKDDEDKEQLNSHISMIENMHYYREAIQDRGNPMLITYKTKALALYDEHLGLYIKAVVRRPLGRLLVQRKPEAN